MPKCCLLHVRQVENLCVECCGAVALSLPRLLPLPRHTHTHSHPITDEVNCQKNVSFFEREQATSQQAIVHNHISVPGVSDCVRRKVNRHIEIVFINMFKSRCLKKRALLAIAVERDFALLFPAQYQLWRVIFNHRRGMRLFLLPRLRTVRLL